MAKKKKEENLIKKEFENGVTNFRYLANKYKVTVQEVIKQLNK